MIDYTRHKHATNLPHCVNCLGMSVLLTDLDTLWLVTKAVRMRMYRHATHQIERLYAVVVRSCWLQTHAVQEGGARAGWWSGSMAEPSCCRDAQCPCVEHNERTVCGLRYQVHLEGLVAM
jgi:hypothetical protein